MTEHDEERRYYPRPYHPAPGVTAWGVWDDQEHVWPSTARQSWPTREEARAEANRLEQEVAR